MDAAQRDKAIERAEADYRAGVKPHKDRFKALEAAAHEAYDEQVAVLQEGLTLALEGAADEAALASVRAKHAEALAEVQAVYDGAVADARDLFAARDQRLQEEQRVARFEAWERFHADHPEAIVADVAEG